ncbi:hypothetical protein SELMODRAFT_104575 [Selaginella moellendorffii]|uniref:Uncharacterized protein CPD-2 n=2 Tax=Selaginella moellendorffii TaxID=88036 RepID=D8RXN2_SELML|nr:hypothetical protein SELMODRAFT_104575 [Selaginella moellendorffii]
MEALTLSWILAMAALCVFLALVWRLMLPPFMNLPPGRMGWPLVGETLEYLATRPIGVPQPFIAKRVARYGSIFKTHLFGCPTIVTTDPDFNRFVLANEGKLFQSSYPAGVDRVLGKFSMVQASGELHKRMRALTVSFMQAQSLKDNFLQTIQARVISLLSTWEGRVVKIQDEAQSLSFDCIVGHVLGMDPGAENTKTIKEDFFNLVYGLTIPLRIPGTRYWTAMKGRQNIVRLVEQMVAERTTKPCTARKDFLQQLLQDDNGKNLTLEQISDFIVFMLFAAHDTTATAMTMAIKYLLANPQALNQLQEEHLEIRRNKRSPDEPLEWNDYLQMTFTQHVINETLRLTNVLTSAHRIALQDVQTEEGYVIPKGWKVVSSWTTIHLNPKLYAEPLEFNPWRWKTQSVKYFTPFSGGPRFCTGSELARLEIALLLHFILTKYSLHPAEDDEAVYFGTVKMRKGLPVTVTKLSQIL